VSTINGKHQEDEMVAENGFDGLVGWCRAEVARLKADLAPLEARTMQIGTRSHGGEWEDITPQHAVWIKEKIVALDDLIIKYAFEV
jgi:hypothetical protein